ncbi:MAG TPA: tetraacyldisaccharide 4'-kinase [Thermoanaerobaculia bacterium]|nr:tetraacyldisaccharide 4'-kinase [Thermoanaerobaculia bacterium]
MTLLLKPFELLYRGVNRARRALYRRGVFTAKRLHRPVISVGNIAAGGTGKTPAVIAVCRYLTARGLKVAVLSRGYGRGDQSYTGIVADFDAYKYGDEPVLIKRNANVDVLIGSNRYRNARNYDCDVFVLDDGFQHLQLARDFDLVIDAPARFYREGRSALKDADAVIRRDLRLKIPEQLRGGRVFAFSGLAVNAQFFASLRAAGLDVAGTKSFPDHHRYTAADLESIRRDAKGATIVTTEKDAVKIPAVSNASTIVPIEAEFVIEPEVLEQIGSVAAAAPERRPKRRKGALLQRVEYIAYRAVARAVTSMSDEAVHRWGTRLGAFAGKILRRRDALAMRNLRASFPDRDARSLRKTLDECWRHFGRELLISIQSQNLTSEEIAERCPFVNWHYVEEAMARGKGAVLISAHWGGWEMAGLAITSHLDNVLTVARPLDNELLERDLQKLRAKTGAEFVDRRKAARALMRRLAENGAIVLLPDQAVLPREGILVPFLGRPAWTTPAPAKMALRADATIVFGFCIPDGLRYRIVFEEPTRAADFAADRNGAEMLTRRINEVISRRIAERPELWLWMHDRWKGTGERDVNGV